MTETAEGSLPSTPESVKAASQSSEPEPLAPDTQGPPEAPFEKEENFLIGEAVGRVMEGRRPDQRRGD